jgi:hypothetical protein
MRKNDVEKSTSKVSWQIVRRPTIMPSKLSMVVVIQRFPWRTDGCKNLVFVAMTYLLPPADDQL